MHEIGVENDVSIWAAKRIQHDNSPDARPAMIKLEVRQTYQKHEIYKGLMRNVRKNAVKGVSIADEIPKSLRHEQKDLEARSYELRKLDRAFRPRIVINNQKSLSLRFWPKDGGKAKYFRHADLENLDKFIATARNATTREENNDVSSETAAVGPTGPAGSNGTSRGRGRGRGNGFRNRGRGGGSNRT